MFEDDPPPPTSIDRPPTSIDPDSIPGRLTLIEERLRVMSIEIDSLRAGRVRRRHRTATKQQTIVKIGLAAALMFVLALFVLYAALAPSPDAALAPSSTVSPPVDPSTTADPDSHF